MVATLHEPLSYQNRVPQDPSAQRALFWYLLYNGARAFPGTYYVLLLSISAMLPTWAPSLSVETSNLQYRQAGIGQRRQDL